MAHANRKSRSLRSAKRKAVFDQIGGYTTTEVIQQFVRTKDPERRVELVEQLLKMRQLRNIPIVGSMCIELAHDDPENAFNWLDRATDLLLEAAAAGQSTMTHDNVGGFRSKRLLASMPHFRSVYGFGKLPNALWNSRMSQAVLDVASDTLVAFRSQRLQSETDLRDELTGELTEQALQLLLLRAAADKGPESWSPAPSLFSQDNAAYAQKETDLRAWDLTIQTAVPDGIADACRVQSKATDLKQDRMQSFASDIIVIHCFPDLATEVELRRSSEGKRSVLLSRQIIHEFEQAGRGNPISIERLDYRQAKLIDLLEKGIVRSSELPEDPTDLSLA